MDATFHVEPFGDGWCLRGPGEVTAFATHAHALDAARLAVHLLEKAGFRGEIAVVDEAPPIPFAVAAE